MTLIGDKSILQNFELGWIGKIDKNQSEYAMSNFVKIQLWNQFLSKLDFNDHEKYMEQLEYFTANNNIDHLRIIIDTEKNGNFLILLCITPDHSTDTNYSIFFCEKEKNNLNISHIPQFNGNIYNVIYCDKKTSPHHYTWGFDFRNNNKFYLTSGLIVSQIYNRDLFDFNVMYHLHDTKNSLRWQIRQKSYYMHPKKIETRCLFFDNDTFLELDPIIINTIQ